MSSPKIMIILSTVRPGRMADRVCSFAKNILSDHGVDTTILDPLDVPMEFLKTPFQFYKHPETEAPQWLIEANQKVLEADGYIIISAEYNASIPPALSNMLDHFQLTSFLHKPAGIVTYSIGPHAGVRGQVALRPFLSEIGLVTLPLKNVAIHSVHKTLDPDGKSNSEWITSEMTRLVKDVEWYANALRIHKDKVAPPPPKIYTPRDFDME